MPALTRDGVELQYSRVGSGPDVVLVHGLGANRAFWFPVARLLAGRARLLSYDLRGHGRSAAPEAGYTTEAMAADLLALLDALALDRVHLVGHSFGGAVALHATVLHPERVLTLTLADSRVPALDGQRRLRDWPHWPAWAAELAGAGIPVPDDDRRLDLGLLAEYADPALAGARRQLALTTPYVPFTGTGSARGAADDLRRLVERTRAVQEVEQVAGLTGERLREVACDVLAVYGQHSHCLPTLTALQELLPACVACVVPGAGHFFPLFRPAGLCAPLQAFLADHPA